MKRDQFALLQHGLAAGDFNETAVGRKALDFGEHLGADILRPPVKVYSESHQEQRRLHPARRTKTQGSPAKELSPCSDL